MDDIVIIAILLLTGLALNLYIEYNENKIKCPKYCEVNHVHIREDK